MRPWAMVNACKLSVSKLTFMGHQWVSLHAASSMAESVLADIGFLVER